MVGTSNADFPSGDPGMYQLDVTLRRGQNLAARDRGGKRAGKHCLNVWEVTCPLGKFL